MTAVCIKCWNPDALVRMHMDGSACFECAECNETFDTDEVRTCLDAMRTKWAKLLAWADTYPTDDTDAAK